MPENVSFEKEDDEEFPIDVETEDNAEEQNSTECSGMCGLHQLPPFQQINERFSSSGTSQALLTSLKKLVQLHSSTRKLL